MPVCGRLLILPPLRGQHGRCQIGNPLVPTVQIFRTTSAARGTGILNNPLYVGRRPYGKQTYRKNPDTGRFGCQGAGKKDRPGATTG